MLDTLVIAGTVEVQNAPFQAYDPVTGEAYRGSGEYVINGNGTRLGPYEIVAPLGAGPSTCRRYAGWR